MQVLHHVINVLDLDVSADGDRTPKDTQAVQQNKRKADAEETERKERKAFRVAVGSSLKSIAITTKQDALRKEEERVERMVLALMEAEENGDVRKVKYYEHLTDFHKKRVDEYLEELKQLTAAPEDA